MQVKLKGSRAGLNYVQEAGSVVDVDPAEAGRLFQTGQCTFCDPNDQAAAIAASGEIHPHFGTPIVTAAAGGNPGTSSAAASDDDDDSPAINDTADAASPGEQTALQKSKAKKASANDSKS